MTVHHALVCSIQPTTNGSSNSSNSSSEIGTKLEGLMSRLELVEKYCQEISREKPQSKEARTFKDDGDDEIVHGDGDIDLQAIKAQSNGIDKQHEDMLKYCEPQVTREEFEKLLGRLGNVERNLINFELVRLLTFLSYSLVIPIASNRVLLSETKHHVQEAGRLPCQARRKKSNPQKQLIQRIREASQPGSNLPTQPLSNPFIAPIDFLTLSETSILLCTLMKPHTCH